MFTRYSRPALVASILLLFIHVSSAAAQDTPPDIRIGARPGESGDKITIVFPSDSQQASAAIPIYIGQGGTRPIEGVTLYGRLDDCQGQPLTQGTLQFLQPDTDQLLGAITLPAGSGQQRARLRVADLGNRYGTFCGVLAAEVGGRHYSYNAFSVQRPAPPHVTIREADGKRITLTTRGPSLNEALLVSETGGKTGVKDLRITISPLRAPGNETAVLEQPEPVNLAPGSSAVVPITGKIPSVAGYRGVLRVEAGAEATEYDLAVERQAMTTTVRMEAVPPVQRMVVPVLSPIASLLASAASRSPVVKLLAPDLANLLVYLTSVDIPVTLVETSGTTAQVYYPALARLTEVGDDDTVTTAQHGNPTLFDCHGNAAHVTDNNGQPNLLTLKSYQTACLRLAIPGLSQAGKYSRPAGPAQPSGGNSSADVPIRLKDHWILAAAVIFLGALLSYSLRSWMTIGRPTQIKSLTVARHEELVSRTIPKADDPIRLALLRKSGGTAQPDAGRLVARRGCRAEACRRQISTTTTLCAPW